MIFPVKTTEGRFCPISAFRLVFSVAILILSPSLFPFYMQVKYCAKRVVTGLEGVQNVNSPEVTVHYFAIRCISS